MNEKIERMNFLYQAAELMQRKQHSSLARHYVGIMKKIATKSVSRMYENSRTNSLDQLARYVVFVELTFVHRRMKRSSRNIKKTFCKQCHSLRVLSNARIRFRGKPVKCDDSHRRNKLVLFCKRRKEKEDGHYVSNVSITATSCVEKKQHASKEKANVVNILIEVVAGLLLCEKCGNENKDIKPCVHLYNQAFVNSVCFTKQRAASPINEAWSRSCWMDAALPIARSVALVKVNRLSLRKFKERRS
jgi:RNase P subunit RPR2